MATDPEMLTFRVSACKSKAPYFYAESIIEVWGQWGTSHSARRGMNLHQTDIFLFFSFLFLFFFLSWRRNSSRGTFKSGLTERRRCEGLNMAAINIASLGNAEKSPSVPLKALMLWLSKRRGTCLCAVFTVK